jgi:hypothetical protein
MPKPIPTIGQPNWGTPLNDHLRQLNDPTNGGINSINSIASRPNTLTAADSGFSAINRATGNIHKWSGTSWEVQNTSVINVLDYGAIADNSTNNTAAFQSAIDACEAQGGGTVFIPSGEYLVTGPLNVKPRVGIRGDGIETTTIRHNGNNTLFTNLDSQLFDGVYFGYFSLYNTLTTGNANAAGIEYGNVAWATLENLIVGSYTAGSCIVVHNSRQWTEESEIRNVCVRECARGFVFKRSGTGTDSFCGTRMHHVTCVPATNGIGIDIEAGCSLYSSSLVVKGNFEFGNNKRGIRFTNANIWDTRFEIMFEGPDPSSIVLDVRGTCNIHGFGFIKGWFNDGFITGTSPRHAFIDPASVVIINGNGGANITAGANFSKRFFICRLPDINDSTNNRKVQIHTFGGNWSSTDIGHSIISVSSRNNLRINVSQQNGEQSYGQVRIYQNGSNYDVCYEMTNVNFPSLNLRAYINDFNGNMGELIVNGEYNTTGTTDVTPRANITLLANENGIFHGGNTLTNQDGIRIQSVNSDAAYIDARSTSGMVFRTDNVNGGTERMRIMNNGNVGIGKSFPVSRFGVAGLPSYATEAAATAAGLTTGDFYQDGTGVLRVKL